MRRSWRVVGVGAAAMGRVAFLLLVAIRAADANNYTADGPCGGQRLKQTIVLSPFKSGCKGIECAIKVIVSRPTPSKAGVGGCPKGPYPIVYMFNGFSARAGFYAYLANRLASYGYAIVQHNVQGLITSDVQELTYQGYVQAFIRGKSKPGASPLAGTADFSRQALVGHSRGGKLAALALAESPDDYSAVVMLDPVDSTMYNPESEASPSAAKALAALKPPLKAAVVGAGVLSACNPEEANYRRFFAELAPGSWLEELDGATHSDFVKVIPDLPGLASVELPPVCGNGNMTASAVQEYTAATTTAWLEASFRNASAADFLSWIKGIKGVAFSVKGK